MYIFVVEYLSSYGLQCVLSNSEKEKTEFTKITLRKTKATLPFAIITVLSNKAFVVDTQQISFMRTRIPWQLAKNSTIHLFLFNTLNNSVFIRMDNLFKEKYLNSPVAYLA